MEGSLHRIVIIGGGFAGIQAARSLRGMPVHITLVDRQDFNLFQPMIVQVATGIIGPTEITTPLRFIFRDQENVRIRLDEVTGFDPGHRRVLLGGGSLPYDTLIVAAGSKTNYFGHKEWAELAPSLKTIADAVEVRRKIFSALEQAESEPDEGTKGECLTVVVVGGGFTGIALSSMIADISRKTLVREYSSISHRGVKVLLLEAADRILPHSPAFFSRKARKALDEAGVTIRERSRVTAVDRTGLTVEHAGKNERIPARTVLWAAGVSASDLGAALAAETGAELDRQGRIIVHPDLSIPGREDIFVIGDLAHFSVQGGQPLAPLAAVASQQGRYVGTLIGSRLLGKGQGSPFRYRDRGVSSVIGRRKGIVRIDSFSLNGFPALIIWLCAHLRLLPPSQNRLIILTRWLNLSFHNSLGARQLTVEDVRRLSPDSTSGNASAIRP
ncbi:MAG TPA: NAD(P)/FAD-dependent oxidoreductase [Deltaproteobacteria bacterium]|nr:NAD(P)/FAD-dependent oxidoreductase [Deltaproteobacteria bacterium]HOI08035.1 NAD(P)/FAD-dependent oxidoreductase [Deltaproteobacteria bacterium]